MISHSTLRNVNLRYYWTGPVTGLEWTGLVTGLEWTGLVTGFLWTILQYTLLVVNSSMKMTADGKSIEDMADVLGVDIEYSY